MAGVENRFRDCSSIALPAATRALLQSHTYAWKTSAGKMDSILSFSQLAFRLLKTNARKTDSILSLFYTQNLLPTLALVALFAPPLDPSGINRVRGSAIVLVPPPDPSGINGVWDLRRLKKSTLDF